MLFIEWKRKCAYYIISYDWEGMFSSVLFTCVSIANGQANSSIKSAGGYAKVINTYSSPSGAKASVVTGWTDRFNLTVTTTGAYDVKFTAFSKTNPWE